MCEMIRTRHVLGFAAIVASAIVVASGLAAISSPAHAVSREGEAPQAAEMALNADACVVDISDVAGADEASPLSVAERQSVDLDLAGGYGVSVACGTGVGSAAAIGFDAETNPNIKADRAPL
jgi:hypothetical protein